jgi:putative addiction module antidote
MVANQQSLEIGKIRLFIFDALDGKRNASTSLEQITMRRMESVYAISYMFVIWLMPMSWVWNGCKGSRLSTLGTFERFSLRQGKYHSQHVISRSASVTHCALPGRANLTGVWVATHNNRLEVICRHLHLIFPINCVITFVIQLVKTGKNSMTALTIKSVGNSAGVLLPKEILTKLRVDKGDVLHVIETENGIELTPYDPEFDAQMAVAEDIMREDRDILRKLAK